METLEVLGEDPNVSLENEVSLHPQLKMIWEKIKNEGLSNEIRKNLLEKYPRKGELLLEAPKINL